MCMNLDIRYKKIMEQRSKKLLPDDFIGDRVRETIRRKHYSFCTEKSYVAWIRRYTLFHNPVVSLSNLKRHPLEMRRAEVDKDSLTTQLVD